MNVETIAPGVTRFSLTPLDFLNAYLLEDGDEAVLVDAGARIHRRALLAALEGRPLTALALTHAHPDHQGAAHAVCTAREIPLFCGDEDREAMETGRQEQLTPNPDAVFAKLNRWMAGPPHPVAGTLSEGDEIAGFRVLETPGHTLGHRSFFRESDGVMILGDVFLNRSPVNMRAGLTEPMSAVTVDPALNRESIRKVAALETAVIGFGHGAPLRDMGQVAAFVAGAG